MMVYDRYSAIVRGQLSRSREELKPEADELDLCRHQAAFTTNSNGINNLSNIKIPVGTRISSNSFNSLNPPLDKILISRFDRREFLRSCQ